MVGSVLPSDCAGGGAGSGVVATGACGAGASPAGEGCVGAGSEVCAKAPALSNEIKKHIHASGPNNTTCPCPQGLRGRNLVAAVREANLRARTKFLLRSSGLPQCPRRDHPICRESFSRAQYDIVKRSAYSFQAFRCTSRL